MFVAPAVACEISAPPTTPRGTSRSSPCLTTFNVPPSVGRAEPNAGRARPRGSPAASRRHAGELATGDVQRLAVDVVAPRRAQEEHAAGRLVRRARAAERDEHRGHAAQLVGDAELDLLAVDLHDVVVDLRGGQARLDVPERDRVDVD